MRLRRALPLPGEALAVLSSAISRIANDTMVKRQWLFCLECFGDREFLFEYRSHSWLEGGHSDWHCPRCHGCRYRTPRRHRATGPADD